MIIIHCVNGPSYRPRLLEARLAESLRTFPVVVVTGARQTGKSTLVVRGLGGAERTYVTFDDPDMRIRAEEAPEALLSGRAPLRVTSPPVAAAAARKVPVSMRSGMTS